MENRYKNMFNIERPKAKSPMEQVKRAAQFSAFAALTGYGDMVSETTELNEMRVSNEVSFEDIMDI